MAVVSVACIQFTKKLFTTGNSGRLSLLRSPDFYNTINSVMPGLASVIAYKTANNPAPEVEISLGIMALRAIQSGILPPAIY